MISEEEVERICRRLCELRGIDPDERIPYYDYVPRWRLLRQEVIGHEQLHQALKKE